MIRLTNFYNKEVDKIWKYKQKLSKLMYYYTKIVFFYLKGD